MKIKTLALLVTACLINGCQSKNNDDPTKDDHKTLKTTPLEGNIQAAPWTFKSGIVRPSSTPNLYDFKFWDTQEQEPCSSFAFGSERQIFGSFPLSLGVHELGLQQPMTIYSYNGGQNKNYAVTNGVVVLDQITNTEVKGRILLYHDESNNVNGTFSLTICN